MPADTSPLLESLLGLRPVEPEPEPEPLADEPPDQVQAPFLPGEGIGGPPEPEPADDAPSLDEPEDEPEPEPDASPMFRRRVLQPAPPRPSKRAKLALVEPPPTPRAAQLTEPPPPRSWTRRMFVRFSRQLGDDEALPALPLRLGLALGLRHVDPFSGLAKVAVEKLAAELSASVGATRRALRTLADHGHLDIERRPAGANIYRPVLRKRDYWRLTEAGKGRRLPKARR